jgi:ribosomal protein bL25 (Ctc-form)
MEATLEAVKREGRGKNEANRLRAAGRIPAVLYGAKKDGKAPEGVAVAVDPKQLLRILHSDSGANTLISLKVEGAESRVMVKEYQLDPVTHGLLHADFYALAMDKAIVVTVPIVLKGEARGVKLQGGMVDFLTRDIDHRARDDDRAHRDAEGRGVGDGGGGRCGDGNRGRARSHQEGQDRRGQGREEGQEVRRLTNLRIYELTKLLSELAVSQ